MLTFCSSAALKTHPDRVSADSPERATRTRKFQLVNDAYYALSDPGRRRDYDAQRRMFGRNTTSTADPFEEADEEIPAQDTAGGGRGNAYSWAWDFFTKNAAGGGQDGQDRQQAEDAQFSDVFEEMMRDEGMAEEGTNQPTTKFWSMIGGLSGGAIGFIVANVPGLVAGAVAGNRLGAVRDAKGKSVFSVFQVRSASLFLPRPPESDSCRNFHKATEQGCSASSPHGCSAMLWACSPFIDSVTGINSMNNNTRN